MNDKNEDFISWFSSVNRVIDRVVQVGRRIAKFAFGPAT